jgi:hypothetical protein
MGAVVGYTGVNELRTQDLLTRDGNFTPRNSFAADDLAQ